MFCNAGSDESRLCHKSGSSGCDRMASDYDGSFMTSLPRLPMLFPCSNYRYDGKKHGCSIHGECVPIQQGPDLSGCPDFHNPYVQKPPMQQKKWCSHLGQPTGAKELCNTCTGRVELKVFACAVHGTCTVARRVPGQACCNGCKDYLPSTAEPTPAAVVPVPITVPLSNEEINAIYGRTIRYKDLNALQDVAKLLAEIHRLKTQQRA